jgi:4-hydroxy-tetrahydrodipicolinate synthase
MVLPPYVHNGPWPEIRAHFAAVLEATPLPAMLYNNPIAYGVDLLPEHIQELAESHATVSAVKESSGDSRRVTATKALLGDRLSLLVGLDDMAVEGAAAGAVGWVAGLVNALPAESVKLFDLAREGRFEEAFEIYRWFLPLLRLDTVPTFVQRIKLVQQEVQIGSERVRPPRQTLPAAEREEVLAMIRARLADRPAL